MLFCVFIVEFYKILFFSSRRGCIHVAGFIFNDYNNPGFDYINKYSFADVCIN